MSGPREDTAVGEVRVSADGSDWRDISPPVHSIDVEDHEYLTDKATILLDDHSGVLAHASFEGLQLRTTLGWNDEKETIFEGVVSGARSVSSPQGPQVELTALDFTYRMSRHTPPAMTWNRGERLSEVVSSIVSRSGYDIVPVQIEPTNDVAFTTDNALHQTVNDLDFVQGLARRYNCRAFIEFDGNDSSNFYFVPIERLASATPVGSLRCCRGLGELVSFDIERISSGALVERTAAALDPVTGDRVTQAAAPAPLPPVPAAATERNPDLSDSQRDAVQALTELAATATANLEPARERVAGDQADPAAAAARVVQDPTRRVGLRGTGVSAGTTKLRGKSRVTISGIAPWAEGEWYVTKVNHVYTRQRAGAQLSSSYVSRFTATR